MVDYTANISDSCHGSDGVFVENSVLVQETGYNEQLTTIEKNCSNISDWFREYGSILLDNESICCTQNINGISDIFLSRYINVNNGSYVNVSFDAKMVSTNPNGFIGVHCYDSNGWIGTVRVSINLTTDFITYNSGILKLLPNTIRIRPALWHIGSIGDKFWMDNISCITLSGADSLSIKNTVSVSDQFTPRNLLPANVADCTNSLGNTTGFNNWGTVDIYTDSTVYYHGNKSIKITTAGINAREGVVFEVPSAKMGNIYTLTAIVKAPLNQDMRLYVVGGNSPNWIMFTGTGDWQKITYSVAFQTTNCYILTDNQSTTTFYIGQMQLELGNVATPWMGGNLLSYNQQTVETDLTGIIPRNNSVLTRDTTVSYKGSASVKCISDKSLIEGLYFDDEIRKVTIGKAYYSQVHVLAENGIQMCVMLYDGLNYFGTTLFTGTGSWQCVEVSGVATNSGYVRLRVSSVNACATTFWADEAWLIEYPIDNIQIQNQLQIIEQQGNLAPLNAATGTDAYQNASQFQGWGSGDVLESTTEDCHSGSRCLKITTNKSYGASTGFFKCKLKKNTTYTVSFWIKGPVNTPVTGGLYIDEYQAIATKAYNLTGDWQKVTHTGTTSSTIDNTSVMILFRLNQGGLSLSYYVDEIQLEEGSVATDWKYPSIGPVNDKPSIKATVPVKESNGKNKVPINVATVGNQYKSLEGFNHTYNTENFIIDTSDYIFGDRSFKIQTQGINTYEGCYFFVPNTNIGKTYTLSYYMKIPSGINLYMVGFPLNTQIQGTGEWKLYTFTFVASSTLTVCYINVGNNLLSTSFNIGLIQLEEGSLATDWEFPGAVDSVSEKVQLNIPDSDVQVVEEISETVLVSSNENVEEAEYTKVISNVNYNESIHSTESIGIVNYLRQTDIGQSIEKVILDVIRRIKKSGIIGRNKYYTGIVNSDKKETVKVNSNKGYTGKIRGK